MTDQIKIAIVGGGVIGCAVAMELSRRYDRVVIFEKNTGVTQGENQSSRNSGVIHSGLYYDQQTRPMKAALCVEGNRLLYKFCNTFKVPALKTGKLIVATRSEEEDVLDLYMDRSSENGVPEVRRISGKEAKKLEPNVEARSALMVPSAGIVEPAALVYRLHAQASNQGALFMTETKVVGIEPDNGLIRLTFQYRDGRTDQVLSKAVINAAGVEADRLAALLNPKSPYALDPVRGESYKFYGHKRPELRVNRMNIYPTPEVVQTSHDQHFTVGVHLTPTFEDLSYPPRIGSTVTVGPKLTAIKDREDVSGPILDAAIFYDRVCSYFPGLRKDDLIWHQMGVQARLKDCPDFVITADSVCPNCINLLGIDSPGLTASLAIAGRVGEMVIRLGL